MARYRIFGPKGRVIVRSATAARVKAIAAGLRKRFGRITIRRVPRSQDEMRRRIVEFCRWGVENEKDIHYTQSRPMERLRTTVAELTNLPRFADCSEFATDAYRYAGAPDPNGNHYDGTGFTGTLLQHGKRITLKEAKPGDLVVYGPGTGHHVCVVVEPGPDPLLCSHGQEDGPILIRHNVEQLSQPQPATWLSYL